MEEMPSLNVPVQRLKVAFLPLELTLRLLMSYIYGAPILDETVIPL